MTYAFRAIFAAIILVLIFAAPMAAGPLEDGYAAYTRGDFTTAMQIMRPLADQGHVTAQNVVGLLYYFIGGDYVSAYMWFTLAAAQGNSFAEMFLKDTGQDDTGADRRRTEVGTQMEADNTVTVAGLGKSKACRRLKLRP